MWKKKLIEFKPEQEDSGSFTLKELMQRTISSVASLRKNWTYWIFVVFICIAYISHNYRVEELLKEQYTLSRELKNLKYEAITTSSELMKKSRQSEVVRKINENNLGLEVLTTPPKTIVVK